MTTNEKRKIAIVTDSASDLPVELAEQYDVEVIQLSVTVGGVTYQGNELSSDDLWEKMQASGEMAKTSLPSIGAFVAMYERVLEQADEVLSIHVSNRLSGTYNAACQAAERFADKVHTFDTLNLSMGQGLQVLFAAKEARKGLSISEILHKLEERRPLGHQFAGVDTLDYLHKGGRVSKAAHLIGSVLNLKVAVETDPEGNLVPTMKARGDKAGLKETIKWVKKRLEEYGENARVSCAIGHVFNTERGEIVKKAIEEHFGMAEMYMYEAGPTVSTHTGPGWGVALYPMD